jgi:hypothetical protein
VRAGLASFPVILAGGWIATQYVYDHIFAELLPGLVGLACGFAVNVVLPRRERRAGWVAASVAAAAAVLAAALGFRLVPGGRQSVVQPFSVVAAPYLSAIIGSVLWPLLFAPRRAD